MLLKIIDKKKYVLNIKDKLKKSSFIVILNYYNLSSNELNFFRKEIKSNNGFVFVVHNNLLKISVSNTKIDFLKKYFLGPIIICFSYEYNSNICKILNKYIHKYNNKIILKSMCIDNKLISCNIIKKIFLLSTKKKAIQYFIFYFVNMTILRLINILIFFKKKLVNKG